MVGRCGTRPTWTAHLVYHAPLFTNLANIFPALAVDALALDDDFPAVLAALRRGLEDKDARNPLL